MAIRTTDYVRFIRGNQAAFDALAQKSPNTLYFISENENSPTGSLYLGSKLIGGDDEENLSQLKDVIIESVGDKQLLYFNYEKQAWVNGTVYDLIGTMIGAGENSNGSSGLVPMPKAGQQNLFLRGDGKWAEPVVNFDNNIFTNVNGKVSLLNFENAESGSILRKNVSGKLELVKEVDFLSNVNTEINDLKAVVNNFKGGVIRTIVNSIKDIDVNAVDVDNYIFMVPNENSSDGNLYSEYMVINKKIELIGSNLSGSIDGYVTETEFTTTVSNLQDSLNQLSNKVDSFNFEGFVPVEKYNTEVGNLTELIRNKWGNNTLVEQVDELTDMLTWYEL